VNIRRSARMDAGYALGLLAPLALAFAIAFTGSNQPLFLWMQHASHVIPTVVFASFWESATYAGDGLAVFALAALFLQSRPHAVWAAVFAAIPGAVFTHGLKALYPFARPAVVLGSKTITVLGPELHRSSFPSGHALSVAVLAGLVCLAYRNVAIRIAALAFAVLVSLSRVAVGVHWPFDIAVGFFGGWLAAWLGWICVVDAPWFRTRQASLIISVVLVGSAAALCFHPMGLPEAIVYRYALALVAFVLAAASVVRTAPVVTGSGRYAAARFAAAAHLSGMTRRFIRGRFGGRAAAGPGASPPAAR